MNKIEKFLGLEKKITEDNFVKGTRGYYCIKRQDTNLADKELMVRINIPITRDAHVQNHG